MWQLVVSSSILTSSEAKEREAWLCERSLIEMWGSRRKFF